MNVFIEPSHRCIQPFGDPVAEVPVRGQALGAWLDQALDGAGLTRVDELKAPCLVVPDNLFTTASAIRRFVDGAAGRNAVYVLGKSKFGEATVPVQTGVVAVTEGWRFEKIRWVSGEDEPAVDIVVAPEERLLELPVPAGFVGRDQSIELGIPKHPVATVDHWCHLLWLNHLARGVELQHGSKLKLLGRVLWAVLRAFSLNRWKVLGKLNVIGKRCEIHPTAIIEGSTLGDGVKVGPYARVFMSHLDDEAEVMAHGAAELSSVGKKATVAQNCAVRLCVLYPEAVSAQELIQKSVLGRRAVMTAGSYTFDLNFENDIRVELDGQLCSTGSPFLGSAFGHDSLIATGIHLASGREIPNGYRILRDPRTVLSKIPKDLPEGVPLRVAGQSLEEVT